MTAALLGGIGLFLLGMVLLTDGLKALAGDSLRRVLVRVVRGPWSALVAGAGATAVVQSSTATTLTTIGFVSAGLFTFPQSIGVIVGANVGTTSTGWLVALLGFKVSLGAIAPPIVLLGVALRIFGRGRARSAGDALAGFGLLFVGIDMLQTGMAGATAYIDPASLPGDGTMGRLLMVAVGFAMTVVMQSSSAAVATTLVALQSGAIGLDQAAALVIGQNIGTTATAAIAGIGAPAPAVRTAIVHILFNLLTGIVAFLILPLFLYLMSDLVVAGELSPATTLAGFHTAFNLLGTLMIMPFAPRVAKLVEWMVPDRTPSMTRFLSTMSAATGSIALVAVQRTIMEVLRRLAHTGIRAIGLATPPALSDERAFDDCRNALDELQRFAFTVAQQQQGPAEVRRATALAHAADHLRRLMGALRELAPPQMPLHGVGGNELTEVSSLAKQLLSLVASDAALEGETLVTVRTLAARLAALRKAGRVMLLEGASSGRIEPRLAIERVEALLRFDRVGYHIWRTLEHLFPSFAADGAAANEIDDALVDTGEHAAVPTQPTQDDHIRPGESP